MVVATGYSDADGLPPVFLGLHKVRKPYGLADLRAALAAVLSAPARDEAVVRA